MKSKYFKSIHVFYFTLLFSILFDTVVALFGLLDWIFGALINLNRQ